MAENKYSFIDLRKVDEWKKDKNELCNAIHFYSAYLETETIKQIFQFTDEEMNDKDIAMAFTLGQAQKALDAKLQAEKLMKDGNLKAQIHFISTNGGKMPERQYQFNYNQKGDEDWESLKKNSDFN